MRFSLLSVISTVAAICPHKYTELNSAEGPIAIARMVAPGTSAIIPQGEPLLSDVIGLKQCTIMSDYTMNLENIARRLVDPSSRTLLLAPLNSAIVALPQKPWKDGPEDATDPKISPLRNEDRAAKNIEAFVMRHVIADYPIKANSKLESMAGQPVTVEEREGQKYVNGKHKVLAEKVAANGAIWVIDGVIVDDSASRTAHEGL